jgi:hypothetical protein
MVKIILHTIIITLLYLSYRTLYTSGCIFNITLTILFIWLLKVHEERIK